ncbi:hypothetical protein [Longimicrobium terrae]|uniref:Uncharacterized protein n=1 Tax=Longimicrobium terrae TaxID=1639882 RepID=A0A841H1Y7_9BACT|nr:hypothetical protein [Longimicrobium terrae]MBB4637640.1 hypothetical protein [Longimicrobium terrae]MBB6072037.1 hypothetical protein [Longimicrobium terrae]
MDRQGFRPPAWVVQAAGIIAVMLALFYIEMNWNRRLHLCTVMYRRSSTAADTAAFDDAFGGLDNSCLKMRQDGTLARHEARHGLW